MMYILFYGIGRFLIEGNRTDSLMVGPLKVSQVVAVLCVITGLVVLIRNYLRIRSGHVPQCHRPIAVPKGEKETKLIRPGGGEKKSEAALDDQEKMQGGPEESPGEEEKKQDDQKEVKNDMTEDRKTDGEEGGGKDAD